MIGCCWTLENTSVVRNEERKHDASVSIANYNEKQKPRGLGERHARFEFGDVGLDIMWPDSIQWTWR